MKFKSIEFKHLVLVPLLNCSTLAFGYPGPERLTELSERLGHETGQKQTTSWLDNKREPFSKHCNFDDDISMVKIETQHELYAEIHRANTHRVATQYVILNDITIDRALPISHPAHFCGIKFSADETSFNKPVLTFSGDYASGIDNRFHLKVGLSVYFKLVKFSHLRIIASESIANMHGLISVGASEASFDYTLFTIKDKKFSGISGRASFNDVDIEDLSGERDFLLNADLAFLDINNSKFNFKHKSGGNTSAIRITAAYNFNIEGSTINNSGTPGQYASAISWRRLPATNPLDKPKYIISNMHINAEDETELNGIFMENIDFVKGVTNGEKYYYTTAIHGNTFNSGIKYPVYFGECGQSFGKCDGKNTQAVSQTYHLSDPSPREAPNVWLGSTENGGSYTYGSPTTGAILFQ